MAGQTSSTKFKPGDPRINRNGAPKKEWTMTELYKEAGDEADETGEPKKKIVARKLWEIAQKGDVTAIKELGNRIDGMPKQTIAGDSENPLALNIDIGELIRKSYGRDKQGGSTKGN